MNVAITKDRETLDDLVARVYAFGRRPAPTEVRKAKASLLEANPVLRKLPGLPAGTAVLVPPLDTAQPSGVSTKPVDVAAAGAALAEIRSLAEQIGASLRDDVELDVEASQQTLSMLRSGEAKRAATAAGAEEAVTAAAEAARARLDAAKQLERFREEVFARIDEDVNELLASLGS